MNVVLVSQKTNKLLRGLIAETEEFNNEYIFTTVYRNTIEKVRLRQRIKRYGKGAGIIGVRVLPHTFRSTLNLSCEIMGMS